MSGWIVIPNWDGPEGFQHYKDRTPRWIKNYTELLHDDAYLGLTFVQRGVLHGLWMEYASARRQIPDGTLTVSRRLGQRVTRATLDALNQAGFIEYSASRVLAPRYQDASLDKSRVEKKEEIEPKAVTSTYPPAAEPAETNGPGFHHQEEDPEDEDVDQDELDRIQALVDATAAGLREL